MKQNQMSCGSVCYGLPTLPANYPWLVAQNLETNDDIGLQRFYTVNDGLSTYECRIPELFGRRIRGFFHDWVILCSHPNNNLWSLWNPTASNFISLPPLPIHKDDDIGFCCLSSPPDDPTSVLLLMTRKKPNIVFCKVDCESRWAEMSYGEQLKRVIGDDATLRFPTCSNGKVYAVSDMNISIIQIDIVVKNKDVLISLLPFCEYPTLHYNACPIYFLLKGSNTELFTIEICFNSLDPRTRDTVICVSLFKLDMIKENSTWEEIKDLKDGVFFVDITHSPSSVYYNPAVPSEELRGHVYIRGGLGNIIYSYNVKDKTVSLTPMFRLQTRTFVSLWESRLEGGNGAGKCTLYSKQQVNKDVEIPLLGPFIYIASITDGEVGCSSDIPLLNIPFHLLEKIMEYCVGIEYMYFRATCKRCKLAAPMRRWSRKEAELRKKMVTYSLDSPWLMVLDDQREIMRFTDPVSGDKYLIKTLPVAVTDHYEKIILCSSYGWLLYLSKLRNQLVFFNPFTKDFRILPSTRDILECICFSAPPTSPGSTVVGFAQGLRWYLYILRDANKDPNWYVFELNYGGGNPFAFYCPTFYGQDLYVLCDEGQLLVFKDIRKGSFSEIAIVAEAPKYHLKYMTRYFLVKRDQHLLLVTMGGCGEFVEVFQLNDSTKEWNKINCLGQHMIYICGTTCLCIEAKTPKMKNKIYLARLDSRNGKIVFYSLETGMFHTFNGEHIEATWGLLFETKYHLYPHVWVKPSWK